MVCYAGLKALLARALPGRSAGRAPQHAAQGPARPGQQPSGDRAVDAVADDSRRRGARGALRHGRSRRRGRGRPHAAGVRAVCARLRHVPRRLGLPLLGGADADDAQLPGEPGRARVDPEVVRRTRRRVAGRRCWPASRPSACATRRACSRWSAGQRSNRSLRVLLALDAALDPVARARAAQAGAALQPSAPRRARHRRRALRRRASRAARRRVHADVRRAGCAARGQRHVPRPPRRGGPQRRIKAHEALTAMRPPDTFVLEEGAYLARRIGDRGGTPTASSRPALHRHQRVRRHGRRRARRSSPT